MGEMLVGFNVFLRGLMEFSIILAFGYWGYHAGSTTGAELLLAIGAPLLGFGFWSLIDFRQAGTMSEPLRLIQELVISVLAAIALYAAGQPDFGLALIAISLLHHGLVYALGERLIKQGA
jgi:hypothetical protein